MKISSLAPLVLAALCVSSGGLARAEAPAPADAGPRGDYLFPRPGAFALAGATGIPYVGIAEAAYGFGSGFALGAVFGATPRVLGVGVRPRGAIALGSQLRAFIVAPIFYYPQTNDAHDMPGEPWVLAYPSARLELASGAWRWHAGAGVIAAACVDGLIHGEEGERDHAQALEHGEPMFGAWNTLLVGSAWAVSEHQHVFVEASVVLAGLELAPSAWIGGPPPAVLQLGTVWSF